MHVKTTLLSSLEKVFLDEAPTASEYTEMSALRGERCSFQWSACPGEGDRLPVKISVESPLLPYIRLYSVGHVPSALPAYQGSDENFLRRSPGLYPDALTPCGDGRINLVGGQWRSVWIEISLPPEIQPGTYPVALSMSSEEAISPFQANALFTLHVLAPALPEQTLIHTEWFHCDCLAVHYDRPVFCEEHWETIGRYMENAVRYGVNMLLTPVITPPLDTQVGGQRPTVQLVGIEKSPGGYRFRFEKLKRFINMAQDAGIRYFEIAHLFTQWGARHAPKIMGTENGAEVQLFGWDTEASSPEYVKFLRIFLTELKAFLQTEGILDACYFHISDEPSRDMLESYRSARDSVRDVLEGCKIIDALSDLSFYREGLVPHPVPSNDHVQAFIEEGVPDLWTYYCCGQTVKVSNRMMAMPSARNRILGWQLYRWSLRGFLHWGFNFWFSLLSRKPINPYAVTDACEAFPSGDAFLVYPGEDGTPVPSIRQLVLNEALQDMRALQLLGQWMGEKAVKEWLDQESGMTLTFSDYPKNAGWILKMREKINRKLAGFSS